MDVAAALPDVPRWVDVRGMLLSGHAEVTGDAVDPGVVVRVQHGALSAVGVVGRPPAEAIAKALDDVTGMTPLLVQVDDQEHVQRSLDALRPGRWSAERAIMHALDPRGRPLRVSLPSDTTVRLLSLDDPLDHLPAGLRHEMTHARLLGPVGATFVDAHPVSFCYPVWTTESLWDVSIDTLEPHRRRALAIGAVTFMVDHMRRAGREPVWGALASNMASLRLAAKLGFAPVDEIVVFSMGPWAYLTGASDLPGSGFRVHGAGFATVQGSGFRVLGSRSRRKTSGTPNASPRAWERGVIRISNVFSYRTT